MHFRSGAFKTVFYLKKIYKIIKQKLRLSFDLKMNGS